MITASGIHHVTAIAGDAQENLDFYAKTLGMRLVKRSINQDVPDTYHLFFADGDGNPGTDMTFFPWPKMRKSRVGLGVWGEVSFTVPQGSLEYWQKRFETLGIKTDPIEVRFAERVLPFYDIHGMALSLTETEIPSTSKFAVWDKSPVPGDFQIRNLSSVRITTPDPASTVNFLNTSLGFETADKDDSWQRYTLGEGLGSQRVDIKRDPDAPKGTWGTGGVHHVAFRVDNDGDQLEVHRQIREAGGRPTEVIDRFWFKSVYVTEPSGALVEVATDGPGFSVDEDHGALGEQLILPPWYEAQRKIIESVLPDLEYNPEEIARESVQATGGK